MFFEEPDLTTFKLLNRPLEAKGSHHDSVANGRLRSEFTKFDSSVPYSVSFWLKLRSTGSTSWKTIIGGNDTETGTARWVIEQNTGGNLDIMLWQGSARIVLSDTIIYDQWQYVTLSRDSADTMTLTIDNSVGTANYVTTQIANWLVLFASNAGDPSDSDIFNLKVWNKYLSIPELQAEKYKYVPVILNRVVAWYPLDVVYGTRSPLTDQPVWNDVNGDIVWTTTNPKLVYAQKDLVQIPYAKTPALDGIWLPDPRAETPELMIPARQPTGPVIVDPDHWFEEKLNCFWLPTEAGTLRDIVNDQHLFAALDGGGALPVLQVTPTSFATGMVARAGLSSGNGYYTRLGSDCWRKGKKVISVIGYTTVHVVQDFAGDGRLITQDEGTAGVDHRWMIGWQAAGNVRTRIKITGASTYTVATDSGEIQDGDTFLLIGSYDGFEIRVRMFNSDGRFVTAVSTAPADAQELDDDPTMNVAAFRSAGANDNNANASMHWAATYSGYISDAQGWELLRNPYRHLVPK